MINKYTFLLLLVGSSEILAQEVKTNEPINDDAKEFEMIRAALAKRHSILEEQWLEERIPLAKFIVEKGKLFSGHVVQHLNDLSVEQPEKFQEHKERFSQFVQKVNDHNDPIRLTADFINIVVGYRTDYKENPSADDLIVIELLETLGLDAFEMVVAEPLKELLDKVEKQLTEFLSTLSDKEKAVNGNVGNLQRFNEFRKEPVLVQLFKIYT